MVCQCQPILLSIFQDMLFVIAIRIFLHLTFPPENIFKLNIEAFLHSKKR